MADDKPTRRSLGRSVRDTRAEAAFKYRQKLEEERRAEKKRRRLTKDRVAKLERKAKGGKTEGEAQPVGLAGCAEPVYTWQVCEETRGIIACWSRVVIIILFLETESACEETQETYLWGLRATRELEPMLV